ncbi:MAG: transposase [Bacteroidetes bacterium]|nr:MAG: transposase [Bacteroidota bacterium]RLD88935.1 MAG: transposase [Bacteroidota bacterium]
MGIKNKIEPGYAYFLTMTVVNWIDVFTRPVYKHIIVDALRYNQEEKGLVIYGWCLMSNHLHMIAEAEEGKHLSDILRDFKKFTSKAITKEIAENPTESRKKWMLNEFEFAGRYNQKIKNYKLWQDGNEAKEIHSTSFLEQELEYIHNNPVRAEIVELPEEYMYSSAKKYADETGLLNVILI